MYAEYVQKKIEIVLRRIFDHDASCIQNFVNNLLMNANEHESPFEYLTECYRRASEEIKGICSIEDDHLRFSLHDSITEAKELVIRGCRLLNDSNFFSLSKLVPYLLMNEEKRPCGFLEDLFRDFDSAETVFQEMYEGLRDRVSVEPLKDFENTLKALKVISSFPNARKALVNHEHWIPEGRNFEMVSILGPFFHVSPIPDFSISGMNDDNMEKYKFLDKYASAATMIQDGLGEIFISLFEDPETRERVFEYTAEMIKKKYARAQSQPNLHTCSSSGTFVNLGIVMLKLCKPFLDYNYNSDKIDPSYVFSNTRLDFTRLTSLHASPQEFAEMKQSYGAEKPNYSSITERFFMTSRVLHLGIIKAISEYEEITQDISEKKEYLSKLKNNLQEIGHLEKQIDKLEEQKLCYEAQLIEKSTCLKRALGFYRLVLLWLFDVLGHTCPLTFACMPEHFVDDAMELLLFAFQQVPNVLDGIILNDFINFIIMFMATPEYIRNPYLRGKMVEVLKLWIETNITEPLFEGNQVLAINLAQSCLKLYVDIEVIGSLMDKLIIRGNMEKLLQNLWKVPSHQTAWRETVKSDKDVYLNFLNFLMTDSIYLLDRSLKTIAKRKMLKAEISNRDEWRRKPAQEREKKRRQHDSLTKRLLLCEYPLAMEKIGILESTIQLTTAPFFLSEMVERVVNTLNYFLKQLIYQKNHCHRQTKLYIKIVGLYILLEKGDKDNVLSDAISRDGRSYSKDLFTKAANILSEKGTGLWMVQEFAKITEKVNAAASEAPSVDEALGDIPDEFLDPIEYTLMKDRVILPSTKTAIDRHVILRHLLCNSWDPFNRSYLTKEMLVPDMELKAKIEEFVRSKSQGSSKMVICQE